MKKSFHTDSVKKTITIKASKEKVWRKISNIAGLSSWVIDVKKTTQLTWQSYFNSKKMSVKQFTKFVTFMGTFYETSLENLKKSLEK